jgi:CubicO group peptidase (beta-lactamase class C family)
MISGVNVTAGLMVREVIEKQIAAGQEIGVQVAAYLDGKLVIDTWAGIADPATGRKVDGSTLFNVFSVTKPVAAVAVHMLVDRGHLDYDTPIVKWWPEYGANGKERTTVRHILTHRAGVPQMPDAVRPELMCDWDWMTRQIAALKPIAEPGSKALYLSMTFGWLCGELVRRADPKGRSFQQFMREEIAAPLKAEDLWIGIPDSVESRIAKLTNASPVVPPEYMPPLYSASMPPQVDLIPEVFERSDVRRASIGGVGGIFTARSCARFWAMLAQGGQLDGARLLSKELVATFNTPRSNADERDSVMFDITLPLSIGGFWLGGNYPPVASPKYPRAICHPGAGNSIAWADPETRLAVSICHNRMFNPSSVEQDSILPIADAIREALHLP